MGIYLISKVVQAESEYGVSMVSGIVLNIFVCWAALVMDAALWVREGISVIFVVPSIGLAARRL